jgi:hypothetical protein
MYGLGFSLIVFFALSACGHENSVVSDSEKSIQIIGERALWEACETGVGDCEKLIIERDHKGQEVILVMPSGGSSGTATLHANKQQGPIQTCDVGMESEYPKFNFTTLEDGFYYASMLSCSVGGTVQIELKTK